VMSSSKFSLIYYYVPEDKDDPEVPNAFGINLPQSEVKVTDIKSMFPLEGEYIFRFKFKYNNNVVWMDLPNDASKMPLFNDKIMIKATRISWQSKRDTADNVQLKMPEPISQVPQQKQPQQYQQQPQYQAQPQPQQQPQVQVQNQFRPHADLLGEDHSYGGGSNKIHNNPNVPDLIDFGVGGSKPSQSLNDVNFM